MFDRSDTLSTSAIPTCIVWDRKEILTALKSNSNTECKCQKLFLRHTLIKKYFWHFSWFLYLYTFSIIYTSKQSKELYRHGMCFRVSSVFALSILFWFPQRTHYFWRVFRFLFMERKQDYNVTSVKHVKVCF